jgi:RNA polymerase sigma-70 factor (ECF subfamily)
VPGHWPESDVELVRAMLRGDEDAFERFFNVAYPAMYRFALARVDFDGDIAGEIAQAAVCRAIHNLRTFRGEAALLTWVCTICRNELYAYEKRHGRKLRVALVEDDPEVRAALESLRAAASDDLDSALDRKRVASLVRRVLDNLPPRYADALEWKYIDEVPVQEIAERLGLRVKAAESLLTRARRAFGDAFKTMACDTGAPWRECNE